MSKPKVIAFYLPQYHPTPDNDRWWGKGFTEWTNVGKAKPLFRGHYQPKVPADLGYYDLRLPEVRDAQAELAREAGIYGFCYYHYWFGKGKEELELPFNEVLRLGKPDFPFMLCWANESWHKKFWDKDGVGSSKQVLVEQTYPGEQDHIDHFYRLLPAFKDPRYISIDGKLAFMIYKPLEFPEVDKFISLWNSLAEKEGLTSFYFIGFSFDPDSEGKKILDVGFDAVNSCRLNRNSIRNLGWAFRKALSLLLKRPRTTKYKKYFPKFITLKEKTDSQYIPTIIPNWDHTPRSGYNGDLITDCEPKYFKDHCEEVIEAIKIKNPDIAFLKSWNEWGEGNYMEPDFKYGKGYIKALREVLEKL
ncbi:MAG: glycoside hydrolase family 99-like domain-containing protein [Muribaculaceae bacterium]|nr:glycoside hydrolase family 99-like domain-containing protein [Muribaculaceae bacterium]